MSRGRLARVKRLVTIRAAQLDGARGELAQAIRESRKAVREQLTVEQNWVRQADSIAEKPAGNVAELLARSDHLMSLARKIKLASARRRQAETQETGLRTDAERAEQKLRKMECWAESLEATLRIAADRNDRRETDELAAQMSRGEERARIHIG